MGQLFERLANVDGIAAFMILLRLAQDYGIVLDGAF
jgi:hypothetical protein